MLSRIIASESLLRMGHRLLGFRQGLWTFTHPQLGFDWWSAEPDLYNLLVDVLQIRLPPLQDFDSCNADQSLACFCPLQEALCRDRERDRERERERESARAESQGVQRKWKWKLRFWSPWCWQPWWWSPAAWVYRQNYRTTNVQVGPFITCSEQALRFDQKFSNSFYCSLIYFEEELVTLKGFQEGSPQQGLCHLHVFLFRWILKLDLYINTVNAMAKFSSLSN